jgi:hypothetical protein
LKNFTCILVFLLFSFIKSEGQITKGNWLLGGNAYFSSNTYEYSTAKQTNKLIGFSPIVGTFLIDKFAVGIKPTYLHETAEIDNVKTVAKSFKVGPFLRYYLLSDEKPFNILLEGSYQYATLSSNVETVKQNTFSINGGPVLFLNNVVGLEFLFGYAKTKTIGYDITRKQWGLSIGLQIHLERD